LVLWILGCTSRCSCSPNLTSTKKPCFPWNPKYSSTYIQGEWVEIENHSSYGTLCSEHYGSERSCTSKQKKKFARPKHFEPYRCSLPDFDAHLFRQLLNKRSLYFVGDSVMMQQKTRLQCELKDERGVQIFGIRFSQQKHFRNALRRLEKIPAEAIILLNVGLHYNHEVEYVSFLQEFEKVCLRKKCSKGNFIWQETAAQHFPNSRNGYFTKHIRCVKGCTRIDRDEMISADFRNKVANKVMMKYGITVLPVFELTQDAHDMHIQFNSKSGLCDCTHYCNSPFGVFRAYNRILQAYLQYGKLN